MNFRQLECFFAVAEHLHFGRAAASLHVGQASVSEAVKGLERQLGAELFHRTTRTVTLTALGAEFLASARPAWDELNLAYGQARGSTRSKGELLLAHTPELGHVILPSLAGAQQVTGAAEDAPLWRPISMHTHVQLESMLNGQIDLGLCWIPTVRPPIAATVLARCPFVVVAPKDDPLARRDRLSLADLRGRRLVVSSRQVNQFIDARLRSALLQAGLTPSALDEVAGYEEIALMVASRGDIGIHPASIASVNRVPGLAFRPLVEPGLDIEVCAIHREADTARLSALLDRLRQVTGDAIDRVFREMAVDRIAGDVFSG